MQKSYASDCYVASPELLHCLIREKSAWAHAVLGQGFRVPKKIRTPLLAGTLEWTIKNNNIVVQLG